MKLMNAAIGEKYIINCIETNDEELNSFLFTLGCYSGQEITLISKVSGNFVISIKDGRYNIDRDLASAIVLA